MSVQSTTDHDVAVALAPPGSGPVAERALRAERPWRVHAVSDPMLAMAEVALAERAARTRAALDDPAAARDAAAVSFILAHPQKWPARHDLIDAIARHFPEVRLFAFDERGLQEAKTKRKATRTRKGPRKGGEEKRPRGASSANAAPAAGSSANSISREEIEMLLGGETR